MKILTILSKLEMGGIENTLLSCLPYFKSKGIEVHVLCSLGGALDAYYLDAGATLIGFKNYKKPILDAYRLRQVIKSDDYDLVHSRYGHTSGLFAWVCKQLKVPFIVSIHNDRPMFKTEWQNRRVLKGLRMKYLNFHRFLTVKYSSHIIGHSAANLQYFTEDPGVDSSKFTVVYNGVNFVKLQNFPQLSKGKLEKISSFVKNAERVIIHIGSFKDQKNHSFLINVFEKLRPIENKYFLLLLGDGELKKLIEDKVKRLNLQQNVYFVGMEANIMPYLHISDVFFFPSLHEGFGNVLIEAQYANVAVCASNIAPHYEAVHHKYYKFFFEPTNENEAVDKLKNCLINCRGIEKSEVFEFAKRFSVERMVNDLSNIFFKYRKTF